MAKIKDLLPSGPTPYGVFNRYEEYFNLLMNAVKVVKNDEEISYPIETFIKRSLFENGRVGYDAMRDKWYYVYGQGLNELGNPTSLIFVTANGKTYHRKAYWEANEDGAYYINALPINMCMSDLIRETTDFMVNCDIAMRQNLDACKTPYIVVCKNKDLQLSFQHALQQKILGQAVILVSEELGEGLKAVNISAEYLVDQFAQARDHESEKLLNKLGIITGVDKAERVQSAEINATLNQATDYIYLLIDTFNKQMKAYNIGYEMKLNESLEEIYLKDNKDEIIDVDVNDDVKDQVSG